MHGEHIPPFVCTRARARARRKPANDCANTKVQAGPGEREGSKEGKITSASPKRIIGGISALRAVFMRKRNLHGCIVHEARCAPARKPRASQMLHGVRSKSKVLESLAHPGRKCATGRGDVKLCVRLCQEGRGEMTSQRSFALI